MRGSLFKLIIASGLTNLGDGIALIAWSWLATLLTRNPLLIALVPVALKLPWFVFSLPAGIVIDRFDRRKVILMADICRIVAYGCVTMAIWFSLPLSPASNQGTDYPGLFILVTICAVITGGAEVLRDNAAQSFLPSLVPASELERANSILLPLEMVMNLLAGTALSGVLIGISIALPFAVNTSVMMIAVILVAAIPRGETRRIKVSNWQGELREGVRFFFSHKGLFGLALVAGAGNFVFFGLELAVILIVQEQLHLGPLAVSAVMISGALGGVVAGSVNNQLVMRFRRGNILRGAEIAMLAFPITVLLSGQGYAGMALICLGFFISEFWGVTANTITISYRQQTIPPELLGRVISVYRFFVKGAAPLGMLTVGLVIRVSEGYWGRDFALTAPYWLSIVLYLILIVFAWGFLGRIFETR